MTGAGIVQACLNGARAAGFHPALPLTADALALDAAACVAAGASELHVHPRGPGGRESLSAEAIDPAMRALRRACPGTPAGVSTGAWIEGDPGRTLSCIDAWTELPDYASVNLSEPDAPAVIARLRRRGVGVEAGLSGAADASRFAALAEAASVLRVLIEPGEQDAGQAEAIAMQIAAMLGRAGKPPPILLHGLDRTVWRLVALAGEHGFSTRIGFEDGAALPDGSAAPSNAALVASAVRILAATSARAD